MDDFARVVAQCRADQSPRILNNASIEHAKVLFENLIKEGINRKEEIRLISGNLNEEFYNKLLYLADELIEQNINVQIIIAYPDTDIKNNQFANKINSVDKRCVYKAKQKINVPHFILVGDKRFRIETDHEETKAIACFNNEVVGKSLKTIFEQAKATCC